MLGRQHLPRLLLGAARGEPEHPMLAVPQRCVGQVEGGLLQARRRFAAERQMRNRFFCYGKGRAGGLSDGRRRR